MLFEPAVLLRVRGMAPLHATTCRGLCLVCGANWNERTCEHIRTEGLGIRERG